MSRPREILRAIPGFAAGEIEAQLSDGPSNDSYLVRLRAAFFVLRIDRPEAASLELDRVAEQTVCAALAAAGLAPEILYVSDSGDITLRPFIEGRSWSSEHLQQPENLRRLADLLRRLHALPPAGRPFRPLHAARRYADQLGTPAADSLYANAARAFSRLEPGNACLCHNDLVCGNILEGHELVLIDWEWAGIGDPYFDLAVVVQHHLLVPELTAVFLAAYLQRDPGEEAWNRLQTQCIFYRALLELWNLWARVDG